jgi:hypothetical protein
VNDYFSVIHGIADSVLRVAVYYNGSAVKISAQRVSRRSVNRYVFTAHAASDKPLSETMLYADGFRCGSYQFVQLFVI